MTSGPREIVTPFRPIPLEVPEGMTANEFFNSAENLNDLVHNNGLLVNPENLLLYRKALGHSTEFDCSIIYNTSSTILNPLGRPVRRTQIGENVKHVWNRMNQIIIDYMLEQYPDPAQHLVLAGEASLDATWPLTSPGVPSIRMLHNHFIADSTAEGLFKGSMSMEIGIDRSQRVAPAGIAAADLPNCDWPWPENTATVTSRMAVVA